MRIMMCVGLEMTREDCLPDTICTECHKELNNYYEFKKRCLLTYQKLKSHVLAVKQSTKNNTEKTLEVNQEQNDLLKAGDRLCNNPVLNICESRTQGVSTEFSGISNISNGVVVEQLTSEPIPRNSETSVYQDVTEFLSSILVELGILSRHGDQIMLMDQNVNLIEIETGDNNTMVLEMLEIDEEPQNVISNEVNTNELKIEPIIKVVESSNNNKTVIQPKKESPRCAQCGKRFASRGALRRHARVHSGERPFACAVCARAFSQREVLRRHELVHKEERPFKCASCAKSFTQRGALAAHARSHAAPAARALALHRCARCPKVFLHASGLSRHAMVHAGRVFACVACARQFSDKSSLLRHLRAKHPQRGEQASV